MTPRTELPHLCVHRRTGVVTSFGSLGPAMGHAHAMGTHDHVVVPACEPHIAIDAENAGDHSFESRASAQAYVEAANTRACRTRYSYMDASSRTKP